MLKILIIGSSYSIKNLFSKKYANESLTYIDFRYLWNTRKLNKFDKIILSGFHRKITSLKLDKVIEYLKEYKDFINFLCDHTNKVYIISTFIPKKISLSRIVYFYYLLNKDIISQSNLTIISFHKINNHRIQSNIFFKILKIFKVKFTDENDLIKNTQNYFLKNINKPRFFFLKMQRGVIIEKVTRLFDID
tara:strand:+ start:346 stop:918 length:573 start_codon:yes stop_codon:yes gene_type:complete